MLSPKNNRNQGKFSDTTNKSSGMRDVCVCMAFLKMRMDK